MHAPKQRVSNEVADKKDLERGKIEAEMLGADKGDAPEKGSEACKRVSAKCGMLKKRWVHFFALSFFRYLNILA
jgi:hypothetical protein